MNYRTKKLKTSDWLFIGFGAATLINLLFWASVISLGILIWLFLKAVFFLAVTLHLINK